MKNNNIRVKLNLIMDAIEMASNEWRQYLDIEKMEIVCLPEYPYAGEYSDADEELSKQIEDGWLIRYFRLPSPYDIHEYNIMERFIESLPAGKIQDSLENAIRGKGAFRRFRDGIGRFKIEQKWYDYRTEAYRDKALEWCDEQGFLCDEDEKSELMSADTDSLSWKKVFTEHIIQDEWIDFRSSVFRLPDGREIGPFYTYTRKDYVVVAATDTEGHYICVKQFRQGIEQVTTEFPAGGMELKDADTVDSDALTAAKRELLEETGYVSDEWSHLLTIPVDATLTDNYAHLYAAKNCRKVSDQALDEFEFINVATYTAEEIEQFIKKGEFQQAMHVTAWLLSRR